MVSDLRLLLYQVRTQVVEKVGYIGWNGVCAPSRLVGDMLPIETWISRLSEIVSDALLE